MSIISTNNTILKSKNGDNILESLVDVNRQFESFEMDKVYGPRKFYVCIIVDNNRCCKVDPNPMVAHPVKYYAILHSKERVSGQDNEKNVKRTITHYCTKYYKKFHYPDSNQENPHVSLLKM